LPTGDHTDNGNGSLSIKSSFIIKEVSIHNGKRSCRTYRSYCALNKISWGDISNNLSQVTNYYHQFKNI